MGRRKQRQRQTRTALICAAAIACQLPTSADDRQRVEQALLEQIKLHEENAQLYTLLGTVYEAETRYDEAMTAYRRGLELNPHDVTALNNLALLLAAGGKAAEGATLLEQALQIAGPRPELLDSRGTVELALKKVDPAIVDFKAATDDAPTANHWFHLALAQFHAQHTFDARTSFSRALELGLNADRVLPAEKQQFIQLSERFSQKE